MNSARWMKKANVNEPVGTASIDCRSVGKCEPINKYTTSLLLRIISILRHKVEKLKVKVILRLEPFSLISQNCFFLLPTWPLNSNPPRVFFFFFFFLKFVFVVNQVIIHMQLYNLDVRLCLFSALTEPWIVSVPLLVKPLSTSFFFFLILGSAETAASAVETGTKLKALSERSFFCRNVYCNILITLTQKFLGKCFQKGAHRGTNLKDSPSQLQVFISWSFL